MMGRLLIILIFSIYSANAWSLCKEGQFVNTAGVLQWCNKSGTLQNTNATLVTSCAGTSAGTIVSSGTDVQFCDGTNWYSAKGSAIFSCAGTTAGTIKYLGNTLALCDGTNWYNLTAASPSIMMTQSTRYNSPANTLSSLSDSSAFTGVGTNSALNQWVQLTYSSAVTTTSITVRQMDPGAPGGWGAIYLNGYAIQYYDGSTWVTLATIGGLTDGGAASTYSFSSVTATQFRIYNTSGTSNFLGVGEFTVN